MQDKGEKHSAFVATTRSHDDTHTHTHTRVRPSPSVHARVASAQRRTVDDYSYYRRKQEVGRIRGVIVRNLVAWYVALLGIFHGFGGSCLVGPSRRRDAQQGR